MQPELSQPGRNVMKYQSSKRRESLHNCLEPNRELQEELSPSESLKRVLPGGYSTNRKGSPNNFDPVNFGIESGLPCHSATVGDHMV